MRGCLLIANPRTSRVREPTELQRDADRFGNKKGNGRKRGPRKIERDYRQLFQRDFLVYFHFSDGS